MTISFHTIRIFLVFALMQVSLVMVYSETGLIENEDSNASKHERFKGPWDNYIVPSPYWYKEKLIFDPIVDFESFTKGLDLSSMLGMSPERLLPFYHSCQAYISAQKKDPEFLELKNKLDTYQFEDFKPFPFKKGKQLRVYSDCILYEYPDFPKAIIYVFNENEWYIQFADGSTFGIGDQKFYILKDSNGTEILIVDPETGQVQRYVGDDTYIQNKGYHAIFTKTNSLEFFYESEVPEYLFIPLKSSKHLVAHYLNQKGNIEYSMVENTRGYRFYEATDPIESNISIQFNDKKVLINHQMRMSCYSFDEVKNEVGPLLWSIYPQGIVLKANNEKQMIVESFSPNLNDIYLKTMIGQFDFWYTKKDLDLIKTIDAEKLDRIQKKLAGIFGLVSKARIQVIIPPDLINFKRLQLFDPGDRVVDNLSSFYLPGTLVLWPMSIPYYVNPEDQKYFLEVKWYQLLTESLVGELVCQQTGFYGIRPTWLDMGLSELVKSKLFKDYEESIGIRLIRNKIEGKMLIWEDAITMNAGHLGPVTKNILICQSYDLVARLWENFGIESLTEFINRFKWKNEQQIGEDSLVESCRKNFIDVFELELDSALEELPIFIPRNIKPFFETNRKEAINS